jgi:hypothetical protein
MDGLNTKTAMDLLQYSIQENNRRFEEIRDDIKSLSEKMANIEKVKAEMIISAKWVSGICSLVIGLLAFLGNAFVAFIISVKSK